MSITLHEKLGEGAYGTVYRATWKSRIVAIKRFAVLKEEIKHLAAIQHEIHTLQQLNDKHIIQFYGTDHYREDDKDILLLIMEHANGGSLSDAIEDKQLVNWDVKRRIAREIASGLAYIHQEGVVHRDLKSANILLTEHQQVKLCDFGMAKAKANALSHAVLRSEGATLVGTTTAAAALLKGTYRWMAPELFSKSPEYSTKSDVYALGMVMWEMAAECTTPYKDQHNDDAVAFLIEEGDCEEIPEDTPTDYRQWIELFWQGDPNQRPDAREMVDAYGAAEGSPSTNGNDDEYDFETSEISISLSFSDMSLDEGSESGTGMGSIERVSLIELPSSCSDPLASQSASTDDPAMLFHLAMCHGYGKNGVEQSDSEALPLFRLAAEQGHVLAQLSMGVWYADGKGGVEQDDVQATLWFRQAAEQGCEVAKYNLGIFYSTGRGVEQNSAEAAYWYHQAAEQGYPPALFNLAVVLEDGRGVQRDEALAVKCYRWAARQGNADAQYNLARMLRDGKGVPLDKVEAAVWLRKAAEQGHEIAQVSLGYSYARGIGVEENHVKALVWFRKAAKQGCPRAQNFVAQAYYDGQGVQQSYTEAAVWHRLAASQGYTSSLYHLGYMYTCGHGVKVDYVEAAKLYQLAAEKGMAKAQHSLALSYQSGLGVEQSDIMAAHWYRKAAAQGDERAKLRLEKLDV
ncbi:hypothetical protein BGZ73_007943 [Actinomortierella ambigua]|nr:hypothetical protein BGZ73_007943 [Actinomortierella ambigua]